MADKTLIIVSAVVGSLGLLSAIFAFSAEGTKLTPYTILVYGDDCIYPQNPALGLGICAAIFLLVAQVVFSAVGGCCGCCKSRSIPSETKRIIGIVCAVASWIAAAIAWVLLIEGAAWNANVVREAAPYCPYLKDGIFAGAGVLALAATALGVTSYIMTRRPRTNAAPAAVVPAKEEPQLPPAAPQPQGNGGFHSHAPNQEFSHQPPPPSDAPSAPPEPSGPPPPPPLVDPPPQVPPPQVSVPNPAYDAPQWCPPSQAGVIGLDVPVPLPTAAAAPATASGAPALSTVVRNEVTRQGIRLAAKVVEHTLLSPTTVPGVGDILVSMMTDSTGGDDLQATG